MFEGMFEMFNQEEGKGEEETEITPGRSSAAGCSSSSVFVVSVGGSILMDGKPSAEAVEALAAALNDLIRSGYKLVLVVGGGNVARDYQSAARGLGANNFELDELGIRITRANASLLLPKIENAFPAVLTDVKKAREALDKGFTPIYGGLMPGFTTDAVAALLAEYLNGAFVNLSNVDGIFTADPAAHPSARLYRGLNYDKLLEILSSNAMKPGQNLILDLPAAMILRRSGITAFFLNGRDLENFKSAVQGGSFTGTVVGPDASELLEGEEEAAISAPRRTRGRTIARKRARKSPRSRKTSRSEEDEEIDPDKIRF